MLYFAAAAFRRAWNMAGTANEGRSIRVQALNLTPLSIPASARPPAVARATGKSRLPVRLLPGQLRHAPARCTGYRAGRRLSQRSFRSMPAAASFRDHTRRSTVMDFWYYLGLELVLGMPVDQPISRWDELFLPVLLADALLEMDAGPGSGVHLVAGEQPVYAGGFAPPPARPPTAWPRYLLAGWGMLLALALWIRFTPAGFMPVPALAAGLAGRYVSARCCCCWRLFTDHCRGAAQFQPAAVQSAAAAGAVASGQRVGWRRCWRPGSRPRGAGADRHRAIQRRCAGVLWSVAGLAGGLVVARRRSPARALVHVKQRGLVERVQLPVAGLELQ